jgi:hypothetical protein
MQRLAHRRRLKSPAWLPHKLRFEPIAARWDVLDDVVNSKACLQLIAELLLERSTRTRDVLAHRRLGNSQAIRDVSGGERVGSFWRNIAGLVLVKYLAQHVEQLEVGAVQLDAALENYALMRLFESEGDRTVDRR